MAEGCSGSSSYPAHQQLENICFTLQSFCWQLCSLVLEICSFDPRCGSRLVRTGAARTCFTPCSVSFDLHSNPKRGSPPPGECSSLLVDSSTDFSVPYLREMPTLKATIPLECLFSSKYCPVALPAMNRHLSHLR